MRPRIGIVGRSALAVVWGLVLFGILGALFVLAYDHVEAFLCGVAVVLAVMFRKFLPGLALGAVEAAWAVLKAFGAGVGILAVLVVCILFPLAVLALACFLWLWSELRKSFK